MTNLLKDKYTYDKNSMETWTIYSPPDMNLLGSTGLHVSNELLAKEIVEELNAAIKFGIKLGREAENSCQALKQEVLESDHATYPVVPDR